MKPTRPLLRYFGGKWQLRHWILQHFPEHQFYVEPFAVAASILLSKDPAPKGEIINDLNQEVINLFRVMQDKIQSEELQHRLDWTPYAKSEHALAFEPTADPVERARRTVIRSFFGIETSGIKTRGTGFRMGSVDLNRFDQKGKRTFRNCARDWSNWKEALDAIRIRLTDVMIYEMDAIEFIDQMDTSSCLIYVDPPYCQTTRSSTRYQIDFTSEQQESLIARLRSCSAMVALSGYDCPAYSELKSLGWRKLTRHYRANMSNNPRAEHLWLSPNCRA